MKNDEKRELTIEELTKQCNEARDAFEKLNDVLQKRKQEEKDREKAQLALEKQTRNKEVENALDNYRSLLKAYIKDYGTFETTSTTNDYEPFFYHKYFPWWM